MVRRHTRLTPRPEGQTNAAKHRRRTVIGMTNDGWQIFALEN